MNYVKLFSIAVCCVVLTACGGGTAEKPKEIPPALVVTEEVVLADMPVFIRAVGTVRAKETVSLRARTSGELENVYITDGEAVKAGQVLFTLDKTQLKVALRTAQANLERDKAQLAKAQDDMARSQKLSKSGYTSSEQYEQARTNVAVLTASIKSDEAQVERAKTELSYADITAPVGGRAGAVQIDKGNFVVAQQSVLVTIDDISTVYVSFAIPEKYLSELRTHSSEGEIPVQAITSDGGIANGFLTFIDNVDTKTGTVMLKAAFPNEGYKLWPGQFVNVAVTMNVLSQVKVVHERAVTLGPDGAFVYIATPENKAELRLVETSLEEGGRVVIVQGVEVGERVITEGHVRLYDNATISIKQTGE